MIAIFYDVTVIISQDLGIQDPSSTDPIFILRNVLIPKLTPIHIAKQISHYE